MKNNINNLELLLPLLNFDNKDDFYYLQILARRKENPGLKTGSHTIKVYYIENEQYLREKMPEIMHFCDYFNARAYLSLTPRSFERVAFHNLKKVTDILLSKDYRAVKNAYDSVAGKYTKGENKRWVIDFDWKDSKIGMTVEEEKEMEEIRNFAIDLQKKTKREPLGIYVPTKNGVHIITNPFDIKKFKDKYKSITLHKNSPTILYMNT